MIGAPMLNAQHLHILQHSLGLDEFGCGEHYRNRFVCGPGHSDFDACRAMVASGLMVERAGSVLTGGDSCFQVTQAGIDHVKASSPKPPKITRSQRRYQDYLRVGECFESFRDYLTHVEWTRKNRPSF